MTVSFPDLSSWLSYLETLHPQSIELGLTRIQTVATRLGLLSSSACPVIVVAGTNGKGSCVALMTAILKAAGYCCGTYISPHLLEYNERVCINGKPVSDKDLCNAFATIEVARGTTSLTYFEFGTLAALLLFKQAKLDVMLLEVGLGGRLDAVNIMDADIAIISSIDLDHMDWLGDTREKIAWEKAGILRPDKPCIWGDKTISSQVEEYARGLKAPIYLQGRDFGIVEEVDANPMPTWSAWGQQYQLTQLPQSNVYSSNVACVLQAIALLQFRLPVPTEAIVQGLQQVSLPGRFQILAGPVTTVLDVAHNPASARVLAQRFAQLPLKGGRRHAVVGMLTTKDIGGTLLPLVSLIDNWYVGELAVPKGASALQLATQLKALSVASVFQFTAISEAYQRAVERAMPGDSILVFGSFYTVAAVIKLRAL